MRIVKVQFSHAGKLYDFNAGDLQLKSGDQVIVETERGRSIATVIVPPVELDAPNLQETMKKVMRMANPDDVAALARIRAKEAEAFTFCQGKIAERSMEMKLVKVEYLFDGSKAIFFFTADGRVDFRELVKDLAHQFHTRIEMRQIGVRDEAKMVGGIGICGRELCCSTFLRDFAPVSVKMAKEQSLALNPTKISGQCGRLLCCLGYEFDTYCNLRQGMPKCGKRVQCGCNEGEVVKVDILRGSFTIKTDDDRQVEIRKDECAPDTIIERPKKQATPDKGKGDARQGQDAQPGSRQRPDKRKGRDKGRERDRDKDKDKDKPREKP